MNTSTPTSRRRVLKTTAWTVPAVVAASAAPAFASSPGGTVGLIPSITADQLTTLIQNALAPYASTLASLGVTTTDKMPRCLSTSLANIQIDFTGTRNGTPVGAGEDMVFTLTGGLLFDSPAPPGVILNGARTQATVKTNAAGKATLPAFSAPSNTNAASAGVSAAFSGKTESLAIPVGPEQGFCALASPPSN